VRCVKDENQKILVRDEEIFSNSIQNFGELIVQCQDMNRNYMRRISESEVKEALKRKKSRKAVGLDGIPIGVWRYLGEMGVRWLTNLFNKI